MKAGVQSKAVFELSLAQMFVVAVIMVGIVLAGYVVGYRAGRDYGLVLALQATEVYLAKLPVNVELPDQEKLDDVASKVYSSLSLEGYDEEPAEERPEVAPLVVAEDQQLNADKIDSENTSATRTTLKDRLNSVHSNSSGTNSLETVNPSSATEQASDENSLKTLDQGKIAAGWYVQVTAPTLESEALDLGNQLRLAGFPAVIERALVQQITYYRVLVGPEQERITAERLLQQLLRERYISKAPFIRRVR